MSIESSRELYANNKEKRIGKTNYNKYGSKMTIIEYQRSDNIVVKFEDEYEVKTQYNAFKTGNIINPYDKSIYGIGYVGEGRYKSRKDGKISTKYNVWRGMLERCYDEEHRNRHLTYKECTTYLEWHNFQNFAKWYEENYYEIDNEKMCLDKDILHKNNKVYSPETCIFVPERINLLFTKCDIKRGEYPIGVNYHKRQDKYQSNCSIYNEEINKPKREYLGTYPTPERAFKVYKDFKESYIKEVANLYKNEIPQKLYEALCRYEVEITD